MDKELHSLSKIFTERLYRIPDYQRGYAWTEKQLKDFWSDLLLLEKKKNHYLGVLTLEEVPNEISEQWEDDYWIVESKGYAPYYIVDGQQRLTTSIILIQSLIECTNEEEKLNYTTLDEIRKKFIFDSKNEGISRSYIFGYERDNPSYDFLKTKIFDQPSETSATSQETIYTNNLDYAKTFFVDKLKNLSHSQKEEIYKKLTQHLMFNIYSISSDIDVFIAFETMNNRGKPLSYLELLKNRLIYLSTRFTTEEYEKAKLRRSINEAWKAVYHNLGRNKNKPLDDDDFLRNHFIIYFGKIVIDDDMVVEQYPPIRTRSKYRYASRSYSKYLLEEKFTAKNILEQEVDDINNNKESKENTPLTVSEIYSYVQSLQRYVELWYNIANPKDSNFSEEEKIWLDKLTRIRSFHNPAFVSPLMMVFLQKEKNGTRRLKFLKTLERLIFLSLISRYSAYYLTEGNIESMTTLFAEGGITSDGIIRVLEERHDAIVNDKEFYQTLLEKFSGGFYRWGGILYFLYEYELHLQNQSKTKREKLDWDKFFHLDDEYYHKLIQGDEYDYKTVEHIYPQKAKKMCWTSKFKHYSPKEKVIIRNSLGNLFTASFTSKKL